MTTAKKKNNKDSALGKFFGFIGVLAAIATGGEQDMNGGAILLFALFLAFVGYAIGQWVELLIVRIIFISTAIVMFLMNVAIRRFIWELFSGAIGS